MTNFQFAIAVSAENNVLIERIEFEKTKKAAKRHALSSSTGLKLQKRPSFSERKLNAMKAQRRIRARFLVLKLRSS